MSEIKEQAQELFDKLMDFGTVNLDVPLDVIEAIDYVANYCGDIAFDRPYTRPFLPNNYKIEKITDSQLQKLKKQIVQETAQELHKLCPSSLSGKHEWGKVVRYGWKTPKVYYKNKRCVNCKMWKDKL